MKRSVVEQRLNYVEKRRQAGGGGAVCASSTRTLFAPHKSTPGRDARRPRLYGGEYPLNGNTTSYGSRSARLRPDHGQGQLDVPLFDFFAALGGGKRSEQLQIGTFFWEPGRAVLSGNGARAGRAFFQLPKSFHKKTEMLHLSADTQNAPEIADDDFYT